MNKNLYNLLSETFKEQYNKNLVITAYSTSNYLEAHDVVPVVRCEHCKHWQPIHEHIPHMECQIFCGAYEHGYPTNASDFCSYGERSTDEV